MEWLIAALVAFLLIGLVSAIKAHNANVDAAERQLGRDMESSNLAVDLDPNSTDFLNDDNNNIFDHLEDPVPERKDDGSVRPKSDRATWLYRFLAHRKRQGMPTTYKDIRAETSWGNDTITKNLQYLMRNGWIHREAYPANRRMYQYVILKGSEKDATTNS